MNSNPRHPFFSRANLLGKVTTKYGDYVLLACCFVTGLLDCSTFNNWSVFVGMQTGNTVILALSTAGLPVSQPFSWLATLVSLGSFLLGGFVTFRIATYFGPLRRSTLTANFLIQALMICIGAALTTSSLIPVDNTSTLADEILQKARIVGALPPLAFQSGAQISTSRLLGYNELPVNVLTSTYADLTGDKDLFKGENVKRNRRLAAFILLFAGALCAAWIMRLGPGILLCLWLGAAVKFVAALIVLFVMKSVDAPKSDREDNPTSVRA